MGLTPTPLADQAALRAEGVVDDDLPGPIVLLPHYFDAFSADLYFVAVGDAPFRPPYGNISCLETVNRPDLHLSFDGQNSFYCLFELCLARDRLARFGYDDAGAVVHAHDR